MFKLGFIESTGTQLKTFYSIKEDINDDSFIQTDRGGDSDLFGTEKSAKAELTLDLDHVTQAERGDLDEVLNNRNYPHKIYLREPAAASQRIKCTGTGSDIAKQLKTDKGVPTYADFTGATVFTGGDYTNIQNFSTAVSYNTNAKEYLHFFFQFDLSTWIAAYGLDYLQRLSLFMQDPLVYRSDGSVVDEFGYLVYAYNFTEAKWTEIKRQPITVSATNQQVAALRPTDGYTKWNDYTDGSNLVLFRIVNYQERDSDTLYLSMNYAELLINGYGMKQINPFNLNWRGQYTGEGHLGQISMLEL